MKKILFVTQQLNCGGVERTLLNVIRTIDRNNYNCDVFVMSNEGEFKDIIAKYVNVYEYQSPTYVKELGAHLRRPSIIQKGHFSFGSACWNVLWFVNRLTIKFLKKNILFWFIHQCYGLKNNPENYDMVIDFHGYGVYTTYYVAKLRGNMKKITWIQEENIYPAYQWIRSCYAAFDRIFSCSQTCKTNFAQQFPEYNDKLEVYYNYADIVEVRKKATEKCEVQYFDSACLKLISVGTLNERKAYDRAIYAASILQAVNINFIWLIIGDGPQKQQLQELIEQNHLQNKVFLHGFDDNPYRYMNQADIFIHTSKAEGYSTIITEAIALGKPIISTEVGGIQEQIGQCRGGIIVGHNPEDIAKAVIHLNSHSEELSAIAMYNANREMDPEREIQKLYSMLKGD